MFRALRHQQVTVAQEHGVTDRQRFLLDLLADPDTTDASRDFWVLRAGFLVEPKLDVRRLSRAVEKLAARHDSLRLRFARRDGDWIARIAPGFPDPVEAIDLGDLDGDAFDRRVRAIAARPMDPVGGRLAEVLHLRAGRRGDAVVFRVHHAVADGTGMLILTEDLLRLLLNTPIGQPAISHAAYLDRFERGPAALCERNRVYWDRALAGFPRAAPVGRRAKGLRPNISGAGDFRSARVVLRAGPEEHARLADRARAQDVSLSAFCYAAFAEALCRRYGLEEVGYSVPVGRPEPELAGYCGDRVSNVLIAHRSGIRGGFRAAVAATQRALLEAVAHIPCPDLVRNGPIDCALVAAGCHPRQFEAGTNWSEARARQSLFRDTLHGEPGSVTRMGPFRLTILDIGSASNNGFELSCRLGNPGESAVLRLAYDPDAFTGEEIGALADDMCSLAGLRPAAPQPA